MSRLKLQKIKTDLVSVFILPVLYFIYLPEYLVVLLGAFYFACRNISLFV